MDRAVVKDQVVLVVTRSGQAIEYKRSQCVIKFSDYGVTVTPKPGCAFGWTNRVHPWANIGTVQESEK